MKSLKLLFIFLLISFNLAAAQTKHRRPRIKRTHMSQEDAVTNLVINLPEVKKMSREVVKNSKGSKHLITYIVERPDNTKKFYWVKVAEDNGMAISTRFNFKVDAKKHTINYYDAKADKIISLDEWRKKGV